jgi:regulator of sigma E protease
MDSNKSIKLLKRFLPFVVIAILVIVGIASGKGEMVKDISMATGLILLAITILVTIHELGHFLTAKWFGMRVEAFSIGFPPKIFGFKKGDTEYQIGAIPLGGYVKITGIIDESMDTDFINKEPEPWEFRSKPVWQRLLVMTGGVIMNILLGIFIFSMIKFIYGDQKVPMTELNYGIEVVDTLQTVDRCGNPLTKTTLGYLVGFRTGDELLSFKGEALPYFQDYTSPNLLLEEGAWYEVKRNGEKIRIDIPGNVMGSFSNDTIETFLFGLNMPALVKVVEGSPADRAGLQTGDEITAIDSTPVRYYSEILKLLPGHANKEIALSAKRGNEILSFSVQMDSTSKLGVYKDPAFAEGITIDKIPYNIGQALIKGNKQAFTFLFINARGLGKVVSGEVPAGKSVMGPFAIAKQYLDTFVESGWLGFMGLTAALSMILAFVNILPIPALDGGHVVFLLLEAITGREPSVKVRMVAQQIGMFLILGLMVLVIFNDFFTHLINPCP